MQIKMSANEQRGLIFENVKILTGLRRKVLLDGVIEEKAARSYRETAGATASLCGSAQKREITGRHNAALDEASAQDSAVSGYDTLQDGWWVESSKGREFVDAVRLLTLQYMHGGVSGKDDVFHVFQAAKALFEGDAEERRREGFVQPAHGGLLIPHGYLGPLLASLADNRHLVPIEGKGRLVLRLDWHPDDGENGVGEVEKLIKAAGRIGYPLIEFEMPRELKYDELAAAFGGSLTCRQERVNGKPRWVGVLRAGDEKGRGAPDALFQSLEFGGQLTDVPEAEFDGHITRRAGRKEGVVVACALDSVGFSGRMLFMAEGSDARANGGLYFPQKEERGEELLAQLEKMVRAAIEKGIFSPGMWKDSLSKLVERLGGVFAYAVLRESRTGKELSIEICGDEMVWCDAK